MNKSYCKHLPAWLYWLANRVCSRWFVRNGMILSRYVDIRVWNKP